MIKKFKEIENLAVFNNFRWDNVVTLPSNQVINCGAINVLYGRNYSGKTTLSRITRAAENGHISEKFENPRFTIEFMDGSLISQDTLNGHGKAIRVFNEDFVRDNLKFMTDPDASIESFAILGESNNEIEEQIQAIENEIGSAEDAHETGLLAALKERNSALRTAQQNHSTRSSQMDGRLATKATDQTVGIKYNSQRFGDVNYTKVKLQNDIRRVTDSAYICADAVSLQGAESLILESLKDAVPELVAPSLLFESLSLDARVLIEKKISQSDKIDELLRDIALNNWVKQGRHLHKDKRTTCAFCNNEISAARWQELEKHFDEESSQLESSIDALLIRVKAEIARDGNPFATQATLFYAKFNSRLQRIATIYNQIRAKYTVQLEAIKAQLEARKNNLITVGIFQEGVNFSRRLLLLFDIFEKLRQECNAYSSSLGRDQSNARETLRLKEVANFAIEIDYLAEVVAIADLETIENSAKRERDETVGIIAAKNGEIAALRRQLKDETKGADKVNEYLNNFFGHNALSLKAIEQEGDSDNRAFRFEIIRDGVKAYHLSEGENSLIAFCYFMARLNDIDTKGIKPIIWIDDPISSLDSNHIFFIYSLIKAEIVDKHIFEQLFVSTHNLDFLKYLKRLNGKVATGRGDYDKRFFIIERNDRISTISLMPDYLKEYSSEFNYLFHQVYKCSQITSVDDSNYTTFYNFGNNARKFLEIYLHYKFPDGKSDSTSKLQKFFDGSSIPPILLDRLNNEYSHLSGAFERGATVVEVPEMKSAAEMIINRIKITDLDQYNSLLLSIGITPAINTDVAPSA